MVGNDVDGNSDPIAVALLGPALSVTIQGDALLETGEQGSWQANASHGTGSYSYQWYYREGVSYPWVASGTDSDTFSHTFTQEANTLPAGVKVEVTSGGEFDDYQFNVYVSEGECDPQTQLCEN